MRYIQYIPFLMLLFSIGDSATAEEKPKYRIIDVHEHILSHKQAPKFNRAIKAHNLDTIVLVASPLEVLSAMDEIKMRFTRSQWNNNELLQISKNAPEQFYAFATYSPEETNIVQKLKVFIENGGKGLKLYNGHFMFYDMFNIRLDAPHMMKVYQYCESNRIPVIYHVNARYYWPELKHVLDSYPKLIINLPHFCMSVINLDRICEIFDRYENVYSDISCGEDQLGYETLEYISRYWELYRKLMTTYKTRFLFGTDMVLTDTPQKDEKYAADMVACYRDMLEKEKYTGVIMDSYLRDRKIEITSENSVFNGLRLDEDTLRHIYEINPKRFLGMGEREKQ